jgi:hypothetical protein
VRGGRSTTHDAPFSNPDAAQEACAPDVIPLARGGSERRGTGDAVLGARSDEIPEHGSDPAAGIPEIRPWREVGWIFKDGDALAIERQGELTRARTARLSHLRDE